MDQRRNQRYDFRFPFELVGADAGAPTFGETKNICSAGVLFSAPVSMSVGDPIHYVVTLPSPRESHAEVKLRCFGRVLRQEHQAYAASVEQYELERVPIM